jgi:hypothetical protein
MFKFLNNLFCFYRHMINNLFIYLTVQTSCSVNNSQGACGCKYNVSHYEILHLETTFQSLDILDVLSNSLIQGEGLLNVVREVGIPPNKSYLASLWTRLWCLSIFTSARGLHSNNLNTLHCYAMQYNTLQKI